VAASRFAEGAVVARVGGDEFAILVRCPGVTCDVGRLAEAVLEHFEPGVEIGSQSLHVSASIGVVISAGARTSPQDLLRDADLAMYQAKELGKNRWHLFDPALRDRAKVRTLIARDLRYAVERNELLAVYQPQVNLRTRAIAGFEALLRWRHPELGMVMPRDFIPVAEETGVIVPAGEWILARACRQLAQWQQTFPADPPLTMSVNLSVQQLISSNLPNVIRLVLDESGIAPNTLTLELTESSVIAEREAARSVLAEIHAMGVSLKLDDFGTGYASLSYLNLLRFDALKIDHSFVSRLESDTESRTIVRTIMSLARELGMDVIAEGIETEAEMHRLRDMGCETGQGYYFSMPVEAHAAAALLEANFSSPSAA
jgi:predicted signal transduction protein with EAL and GGDEF domain